MPFQSGFEHILREREAMAPYTWLRLGGEAEYFAEPTSVEELVRLGQSCHQEDMPVRLLGGGGRAYAEMRAAIDGAARSVTLCTYIFDPGVAGDAIAAALRHTESVQPPGTGSCNAGGWRAASITLQGNMGWSQLIGPTGIKRSLFLSA